MLSAQYNLICHVISLDKRGVNWKKTDFILLITTDKLRSSFIEHRIVKFEFSTAIEEFNQRNLDSQFIEELLERLDS